MEGEREVWNEEREGEGKEGGKERKGRDGGERDRDRERDDSLDINLYVKINVLCSQHF